LLWRDTQTGPIDHLVMTPDGRLVLSCSGQMLVVRELKSGHRLRTINRGHSGSVLAVSSDGRRVACDRYRLKGAKRSLVDIWDLPTEQCLQTLEHAEVSITAICWLTGSRLLTGDRDGTLWLWDWARTKRERLLGHAQAITAIAVAPPHRAVTGSRDGSVRVWDLGKRQCVASLWHGQGGAASGVALAAAARRALTAGEHGALKLWCLEWQPVVRRAADWDESARPLLDDFLARQRRLDADGIGRSGPPTWDDDGFEALLARLRWAGYGWLRETGVRRELERAANRFRD